MTLRNILLFASAAGGGLFTRYAVVDADKAATIVVCITSDSVAWRKMGIRDFSSMTAAQYQRAKTLMHCGTDPGRPRQLQRQGADALGQLARSGDP